MSNKLQLEVMGHAGFNPGNDIVCSAISALAYTYAGAMNNLKLTSSFKDLSGDFLCEADISGAGIADKMKAKTIFNTIFIGIKQVADSYPENVVVKRFPDDFERV
jgi:uncharacterized protein YsxB (DUF464 family)